MMPEDLPVVRRVLEAGSSDPLFDLFMLLGPILIVLVAVIGRSAGTVALASAYVGGFLLYVVFKWARF